MMLLVEHQIGMKSYIVGQGHNQICTVHLPKVLSYNLYVGRHECELVEEARWCVSELNFCGCAQSHMAVLMS